MVSLVSEDSTSHRMVYDAMNDLPSLFEMFVTMYYLLLIIEKQGLTYALIKFLHQRLHDGFQGHFSFLFSSGQVWLSSHLIYSLCAHVRRMQFFKSKVHTQSLYLLERVNQGNALLKRFKTTN